MKDTRPMHEVVAEVGQFTRAVRDQLRSYGPEVQAAVLADLVATWIAAWPKPMRAGQLSNFLDLVDDLTPIACKSAFESVHNIETMDPTENTTRTADMGVRRFRKS